METFWKQNKMPNDNNSQCCLFNNRNICIYIFSVIIFVKLFNYIVLLLKNRKTEK